MTWKELKPHCSMERGVIALLIFYLVLTLIQLERVGEIADARVRGWVLLFMVVRLGVVFVITGIAVTALSAASQKGHRDARLPPDPILRPGEAMA